LAVFTSGRMASENGFFPLPLQAWKGSRKKPLCTRAPGPGLNPSQNLTHPSKLNKLNEK